METYFVKDIYVLYIACRNLRANVDQQHNLCRQTQTKQTMCV